MECVSSTAHTPYSRLILEKLTVSQLVKKFPAFYGNRKFITAFKEPATCPYPEPHKSSPSPLSDSGRFILILPSHLRLGLRNVVSFSQDSQPNVSAETVIKCMLLARPVMDVSFWHKVSCGSRPFFPMLQEDVVEQVQMIPHSSLECISSSAT